MTPVLCFDLETVPDVAGLRLIHGFDASVDDAEVAERAFARRREQTGSDFLPLHLHRVVAIGALLRTEDELKVRCIGEPDDPEAKLIRGFYQLVERHTPQLVSWNGGGFDLQVLHYRALVHGAQAARYWEQGDEDREFKWNNYLGRYHSRHLDLMDVLALYTPRANAPLDELAKLMGLPGKLGMDGSAVWGAWQEGRIDEIRDYCETDVVNTFLVYLHFQRMRGVLTAKAFEAEMQAVRSALEGLKQPHWQAFLAAWAE